MRWNKRGVTLTEAIITVGIIGVAVVISNAGLDFIKAAMKSNAHVKVSFEGNLVLDQIIQDVRNAAQIEEVTDTKLVLQIFNEKKYGFNDLSLFDEDNFGTKTYEYKSEIVTNPDGTELTERFVHVLIEFDGEDSIARKYLVNMVIDPAVKHDPSDADEPDYMFKGLPEGVGSFESVAIYIKCKTSMDPHETEKWTLFRGLSMNRTGLI